MVGSDRHRGWIGFQVDDAYGARIGTVEDVLLDPETDVLWLVVAMGRVTRRVTLAPAVDAMAGGAHVRLSIPRGAVRSAPRAIEREAWLRGSYRSLLYRHYGLVGLPRRRGGPHAVGAPGPR